MKQLRGTGSNKFDNDVLSRYYDDIESCSECGKYKASQFHHSVVRANDYSDSPFNATKICSDCHTDHGRITQYACTKKYIKNNIRKLLGSHNGNYMFPYEITERDNLFLEKYKTARDALEEVKVEM